MKKIIFIAITCFVANVIMAQAEPKPLDPATAKVVDASNMKPGAAVVDPIINGMPYSQYKAQQDALKKQLDAQRQASKPQVPEQFKTQEVKPWNGTMTQAKTTIPVVNPAQTPGNEASPVKPIMAPDKADRSAEEVEKSRQKWIAEENKIKANESEKNTVSSKEVKTPVSTVQPVVIVKDMPEASETKTTPVVATQNEKSKSN